MAVRTVEFSVSRNGITPAYKQFGGVQGDHRSTKLIFTLDTELYTAVTEEAEGIGGSAVYRFDGYDGEGGVFRSDTSPLTGNEVSYYLEEWITRYGGTVKAVLVISVLKDDTAEMELYSFPALLQLKSLPFGTDTGGENLESMSSLTQSAKEAAERAAQSAQEAEDAQNATELARFAIENGSTIVFDGNGTFGLADPVFVVDDELSTASENAIANKAVMTKFNSLETDLNFQISEVEESANTKIAKCEIKSNKADEFSEDIEESDAKAQYPSVKLIKDMVRVIETGSFGIWTYRKWSDGTAECWGMYKGSVNITTSGRGSYYTTVVVNFPTGLFISDVTANANVGLSAGFAYCGISGTPSVSSVHIIFVCQESMPNVTADCNIYARGRWR